MMKFLHCEIFLIPLLHPPSSNSDLHRFRAVVTYGSISTGSFYRVFQKEHYNGIPNVTVWRVLRKRLQLKAYKRSEC
jgi:uncharacterized membrane protein